VLATFVALGLLVFPLEAASVFIAIDDPSNAEVRDLIVIFAAIAAPLVIFEAFHITASRALRGRHDTWVPMWISSLGAWVVAVPLGLFLAYTAGVGPAGLWWAFAASYILTGTLMLRRWQRGPMPAMQGSDDAMSRMS